MKNLNQPLKIADRVFQSRLLLGTGKFGSSGEMKAAIIQSETEMVTVALKRIDTETETDLILEQIDREKVQLLPNTSGARNAKEAIFAAQLAREALETNWLKLEIHPDPKYLLPDPIETWKAAEELAKLGFVILPYIHADPVLCKRLEDVGTSAVMPLGSPIGTNKGLKTDTFLEIILEQSKVPVIIDAGIGSPSDAAIAMAGNPGNMARAFHMAVVSGRIAFKSGLGKQQDYAEASSPLTGFLNGEEDE
jgi:thiazole synthase